MIKMLSESKFMTDQEVIAAVESGDYRVELPEARARAIAKTNPVRFIVQMVGNADIRYVLRLRPKTCPEAVSRDTRESATPAPRWSW